MLRDTAMDTTRRLGGMVVRVTMGHELNLVQCGGAILAPPPHTHTHTPPPATRTPGARPLFQLNTKHGRNTADL